MDLPLGNQEQLENLQSYQKKLTFCIKDTKKKRP